MKDSASANLENDRDAEFFPDDFKKYMLAELCWEKRHKEIWEQGPKERRDWVFWSRDDGKLPLRKDDSDLNFNPEALKRMVEVILATKGLTEHRLLVQFWAHRTAEGRSLLTCKNEPFALRSFDGGLDIDGLCSYRKISEEYIIYLDDSDERLGPIGRAFLNCSQESSPNVEYYSTKEYPLRHHALHCQLRSSFAAPLFQYSKNRHCIGVLEIVSTTRDAYLTLTCRGFEIMGSVISIFAPSAHSIPRKSNSSYFSESAHPVSRWYKEDVYYEAALNEIIVMFGLVRAFHEIYLAQLWLPKKFNCDWIDEHLGNFCVFKYLSKGYGRDLSDQNFAMICDKQDLQKGAGVVGRALKSPNLVYCTDITQFGIVEYPLAHYARLLGLGGCGSFALCLKSIHTEDEVYVVEFILPVNYEISEDIIRKILGTMIACFDTFKLASGDELTEEITIEVIDFHDGEKNESIQTSQTAKCLPLFEPSQDVGELDLSDQQLAYATNNGRNVVSAEQCNVDVTRILPGPEPLQNGDQMMQLDLLDQQLLDGANNESNVVGAEQSNIDVTRFLQLEQLDLSDQQSVDGAKNESNVVGAEQSNIDVTRFSPGPEPLQNGGLDLWDQQLVDGANHGNNVVGAEQSNVDVTHSQKKGTRREPKKGETGTRIEITLQEIEQCSEMTLDAAAEKLKVSRSTLKRVRESYGIKKWHPHEIKRVCRAGIASKSLPCVYQTPKLNSDRSQTRPCDMVMQDNNSNNKVTIKAKYEKRNFKFQLSMPPRVEELQKEVAKRLDMEAGTYDIQYEDVEDGDMISICCNDDLQGYVATCASKGVTSVVIFLSKNI